MKKITVIMATVGAVAPVAWDRYTDDGAGYYVVYGWISRSDGQRDFVLLAMHEQEDVPFYTTSSAKYSETIAKALYGTAEGHNPCRKVAELSASNSE